MDSVHREPATSTELSVPSPDLGRRLTAEFLGTLLLVAVVVGSGIAAQRLSSDPGLRLLENSVATGAGLVALILCFGSVSGARFNPLVSVAAVVEGSLRPREAAAETVVQTVGAIAGCVVANLMFDLGPVTWSRNDRVSSAHGLAEVVATFGLVLVISGAARTRRLEIAAVAVGGYIAAAYWFTSSTSFANPAVAIGRAFTDSFAGIAPRAVPVFVLAQLAGAALAIGVGRYLHLNEEATS